MGTKSKHKSVKARILEFFLENVGRTVTRREIISAATDPATGDEPENWHQRLSDLRCIDGYTIETWRDDARLRPEQYRMPHTERRSTAGKRLKPSADAWRRILERAEDRCEWSDGGYRCALRQGELDPIGGGTVRLQADHRTPHSIEATPNPDDPSQWQALCGRHQIVKKNYWDDETGKLNVYAILQSASREEKRRAFEFLRSYFGYEVSPDSRRVGETKDQ